MNNWFPEIVYEAADGVSSRFPFIVVPDDQEMPKVLYIIESRDTGERATLEDGSEQPVMDMEMHQYADMSVLKKYLSTESFDAVRSALGLEPLAIASQKGEKINESVRKKLD